MSECLENNVNQIYFGTKKNIYVLLLVLLFSDSFKYKTNISGFIYSSRKCVCTKCTWDVTGGGFGATAGSSPPGAPLDPSFFSQRKTITILDLLELIPCSLQH